MTPRRAVMDVLERLAILYAGRVVDVADLPEKYRPGVPNVSALVRRPAAEVVRLAGL